MIVKLPFTIAQQITSTKQSTPPLPSADNSQSTKSKTAVLLVDDNNINRKLGLTMLKSMGYNVTLASNGIEAIEALKKTYYPLVFMDCRMPGMNGYDATNELRKLEKADKLPGCPHPKKIAIIGLTANASPEDREKCMRMGMDDYIRKPCRMSDLRNAVETYLHSD